MDYRWENTIYTVDSNDTLHTKKNKGRESNAYLTYLVENYDNLRDITVFLHPARKSWHNDAPDYDSVISLKRLKINYVLQKGYVNLRCNTVPGCPGEVQPFRLPPDGREFVQVMPEAWKSLFNNTEVPTMIGIPCCTQFAVSREQIRSRSKEEYQRYLDWLMATPLQDYASGRIFEYLWHIIFGQNAIFCPSRIDCYCDVYGWCNSDRILPFVNEPGNPNHNTR
jgi:hypothetical protein